MSADTHSSETIFFRRTFVGAFLGAGRDDDFQIIWRGLPVARITSTNTEGPQWCWRCTLPGRPLLGADYGTGDSIADCEAAFRTAWTRIRAGLTDADIAKAVGL